MHFNLRSLLNVLYTLATGCEFELIIIEGLSPLLFAEEESDLVKELESILKRLSLKATVLTTSVSNDSGNIIGHFLWTDAVTNNLFISRGENDIFEVTHYKYNINTAAFSAAELLS